MTIGIIFAGFLERKETMSPPAGPYRLRTYLEEHGHSIKVVNYLRDWTTDEMAALIRSLLPDLKFVGFSTTFHQTWGLREYLTRVRAEFPQLKIVLGGSEVVFNAIHDIPVDRAFIGYSELAFLRYVDHLAGRREDDLEWKVDAQSGIPYVIGDKQYPFTEAAHLPIRWKPEDGIVSDMALPIEISRGCIFRCKFCSFPLMGKKDRLYIRSVESLAEEFRRNYETLGVRRYTFIDDTFNDSLFKLEVVQEALKRADVKIRFAAYLRLDLIARIPQMMDMLLDIGLLGGIVGIESLDEKARHFIGKGLSNQELLDTLAKFKAKRRDLWFSSGFIVGLPGETLESVAATHRFLLEQKFQYLDAWGWTGLYINQSHLRLESEFSRNPEKYGYIVKPGTLEWTSPITTRAEASEIAARYAAEDAKIMRPTGFVVNELAALGLPIEAMIGRTRQEIEHEHQRFLQARKTEIIANHKRNHLR